MAGALSPAGLAAVFLFFMPKPKRKPEKLIGIEFIGPRGDKTISTQIRRLVMYLSRIKGRTPKEIIAALFPKGEKNV